MVEKLCEKISNKEANIEKIEQNERGKRIKKIREELRMNKTEFGQKIGVSGQFIGLVEEGRGNLTYKSLKRLISLTGHSADYILYGLDDNIINNTKKLLKRYKEEQIIKAINVLKEIANFIDEENFQ